MWGNFIVADAARRGTNAATCIFDAVKGSKTRRIPPLRRFFLVGASIAIELNQTGIRMKRTTIERRTDRRYELRFPLRYRVSQKGEPACTGTGLTSDLSVGGIAFRCRKPLPVGAHVELLVDWPARYGDAYPIELRVTGFVVRSTDGQTAMQMTSHRLRVSTIPAGTVRASA